MSDDDMNRNVPQASVASREVRLLKSPPPRRSGVVIVLGLVAFVLAVVLLMLHRKAEIPPPAAAAIPAVEAQPEELTPIATGVEDIAKKPAGPTVVSRRQSPTASTAVPASSSSLSALPASAAYSDQLISRLSQANPALSPADRAKEAVQTLKELTAQGQVALPAIRQFLERNQDMGFDAAVGYPSLRAGLFDALGQIGGPEAMGLLADTLRSTADPAEIALLAKTLIAKDPSQYQQQALNAARETLDQIARGGLTVGDVGPLFQVLRDYGDSAITADLANRVSQWQYYATMSLAQASQGQGIPSLIHQVQVTDGTPTEARTFALRMLAQVAGQYPDAASALLEQARANQVSDRAWRQIASGLAGDQYFFGGDVPQGGTPPPGFKTYHIERGNQNFYSLPVAATADLSQRIATIDQLLAVTTNPAGVAALNEARGTLSGMQK